MPDISFVDEDVLSTLNNLIITYEALTDRNLSPADPVRLFLNAIAVIIVQQRVLINQTAKENFLRYARGPVLDQIGARSETTRLAAAPAKTTLRFTLSAPQPATVNIPAGTRVSTASDPKIYFATTAVAQIASGQTTVDVSAECTEAGVAGNGFLTGQINQIVDPIAFVTSAANTTTSSGGADIEDDDAYRERIYTAPEGFSTAGPEEGYIFWAKTASPSIVDVSVSSPADGQVTVVPLLEGGAIPGADILDAVSAKLNDKRIRPLTDRLTVSAPTAVNYAIDFSYVIHSSRSADVAPIQAAVTKAVEDFVLWQKSKLGRSVNPSELIRRIMLVGAYRVTVTQPVYAAVTASQVATLNGAAVVTYGGLVND